MTEELLPCPFCGGTNTQIRENKLWTGMQYKIYSAEIHHWCDDQPMKNHIVRKGKTVEEAILVWNKRESSFAL